MIECGFYLFCSVGRRRRGGEGDWIPQILVDESYRTPEVYRGCVVLRSVGSVPELVQKWGPSGVGHVKVESIFKC